jgi:hypothetical protein
MTPLSPADRVCATAAHAQPDTPVRSGTIHTGPSTYGRPCPCGQDSHRPAAERYRRAVRVPGGRPWH